MGDNFFFATRLYPNMDAAKTAVTIAARRLNLSAETLWRVWIDTTNRIVSFHEEEGCRMLEFRSREMFMNCVEQYTCQQYRYQ